MHGIKWLRALLVSKLLIIREGQKSKTGECVAVCARLPSLGDALRLQIPAIRRRALSLVPLPAPPPIVEEMIGGGVGGFVFGQVAIHVARSHYRKALPGFNGQTH